MAEEDSAELSYTIIENIPNLNNAIIEKDETVQDINICTLCNENSIEDSFSCTNCGAMICSVCQKFIKHDAFEEHLDEHDENLEENLPSKQLDLSSSDNINSPIIIPLQTMICNKTWWNGCGVVNQIETSKCQCGITLRTIHTTSAGETLYLGQKIVFTRKGSGNMLDDGIIVGINKETLRIKYSDNYYRDDKYDEFCDINSVYSSRLSESESNSRKRKLVIKFDASTAALQPQWKKKNEDESKISSPIKLYKKTTSSSSISSLSSSSSSSSSSISSSSSREKNHNKECTQLKNINSLNIKKNNKKLKKENPKKIEEIEEIKEKPYIDDNTTDFLINKSKNAFSNDLYFKGMIDGHVKLALLYVIYRWSNPLMKKANIQALGDGAKKSKIEVTELIELLHHCPVSKLEMFNLPLCKRLLFIKNGPDNEKSVGEELIELILKFLTSRNSIPSILRSKYPIPISYPNKEPELWTLDELSNLKLSLPLTFTEFRAVFYKALEAQGGRDKIESAVKGVEVVKNSSGKHDHQGIDLFYFLYFF
jgi:hypothetical protein